MLMMHIVGYPSAMRFLLPISCVVLFAGSASADDKPEPPASEAANREIAADAKSWTVASRNKKVPIARVTQLVKLVNKPHIQVNVVVEDLGGSTDVSPTQRAYLTLYAKGEMFSTDAAFDLGPHFGLVSAKRSSGGIYELVFEPDLSMGERQRFTYVVDARKAIVAMKAVRCEDFDCDASKKFAATIEVSKK